MKLFITVLIALLSLNSLVVLADPPAGVGHGNAGFGSIIGGDTPPGLQDKGYPSGLSKQGKIPPGWSKGKKKGWYNIHGQRYYFDGQHLSHGHHGD